MRIRANKQIWRFARFIHDAVEGPDGDPFDIYTTQHQDKWYDMAADLLKKMQGTYFTGEDDHND